MGRCREEIREAERPALYAYKKDFPRGRCSTRGPSYKGEGAPL